MKRRIIKQGHNTLTITLPAEWTKRFNLEAGKEVDLDERDNGLFISTEKNGKHRKAEFDITGLDISTVWKYFMAVYREGYDEVHVKFDPNMNFDSPYKFFTPHKLDLKYRKGKDKETALEYIHNLVNRFIGFEITDHGKDFVVIKDMSEPTSKEFDNALRRVFLLIQQMAEETCRALESGDVSMLRHIHDVDINLDKFHDYCVRIMNKTANKDTRKTSLLFTTLFLLELIADEFKNISIHLINLKSNKNFKNILQLAGPRKEQLDLLYEVFYKFDLEKIKKIAKIDQEEYFSLRNFYSRTKSDEEKELYHHLRIILRHINSLIELRIEMEF
jgi:phosphate uptake regulator